MYKEITHLGCTFKVNEDGDAYVKKTNGEFIHREARFNHDGYPVVTGVGISNGKKFYRSVQVHILVAKAFVPNPDNKTEVNHKDYNRANPKADNLEWTTHLENVRYSYDVGHYKKHFGADNCNYGNRTLHKKYMTDQELAKEKQSRPGGQNGRSKRCLLTHDTFGFIGEYPYQREAALKIIENGDAKVGANLEHIIKKSKRECGYKGYHLKAS